MSSNNNQDGKSVMDQINNLINNGKAYVKSIVPADLKELPEKAISLAKPYVQEVKARVEVDAEKYRVQYDGELYKCSEALHTKYAKQIDFIQKNEKEVFTVLPVAVFIPCLAVSKGLIAPVFCTAILSAVIATSLKTVLHYKEQYPRQSQQ